MRQVALLVCLAAIACDAPDTAPAPPPPAAATGNYKARIDALDEGQRNAVMLRAIRDANQDCQAVIGSAATEVQFGMPAWVARCRDGRDWIVMLRPDGTALVARREAKPAS
jgi:hypothetical protein